MKRMVLGVFGAALVIAVAESGVCMWRRWQVCLSRPSPRHGLGSDLKAHVEAGPHGCVDAPRGNRIAIAVVSRVRPHLNYC